MLLDTSAWVEFFEDTDKREIVWTALKAQKCFTSIVTLAEIANWCFKSNLENELKRYVDGVKANSQLIDANEDILLNAGRLNYERKKFGNKWDMMDSIIVATAQAYGLKILTKDNAFRDLPETEVL